MGSLIIRPGMKLELTPEQREELAALKKYLTMKLTSATYLLPNQAHQKLGTE